ncbi:glycosyltransferase family 4 protein [Nocardioides nitrophenolicus]|uniref:glycosyltransferase family 4 protein n=1 Tax=Nocardioides nitrophenolicus TaxID=60489 RepID=UPI0019596200|nr:glycosyltransferase family 4 protein [Nocardioides nitrophenolicus]
MEVWEDLRGRDVVVLSWRDTRNPEGGGAELYLEKVTQGLIARGCRVTVFTAAYDGAPVDEVVDGIRYVRRGTKLTVYLEGMRALRRGDLGDPDVVVDVQNGLPFFTRLVTRKPVVVLVHHVHREQWPVVYPGLTGRVGWWLESRFAPWLYRRSRYVSVSEATREELGELGVDPARVTVVHNGTEPAPLTAPGKSPTPHVAVVGRLVPHKQVEHAIDAVLAARVVYPDLTLDIVGDGWWRDELHAYAAAREAGDAVRFLGHVDEETKHDAYERAWLLLLPSLKEGWGLVIGEAGMHHTPAIAYHSAGGTRESIADGVSGVLVDDKVAFTAALMELLGDDRRRRELGKEALSMSHAYSWERAQDGFAQVLCDVIHRRRPLRSLRSARQRERVPVGRR